jgi:putative flippase GtrA
MSDESLRRTARELVGVLSSGARIGQFLSVGVLGALFDLTVSSSLLLTTEVPIELAKALGAEVAIIVMFLVNEHWTFAAEGKAGRWHGLRRFVTSNLVRSVGLGVQVVVVSLLASLSVTLIVFETNVWQFATLPMAIGSAIVVNYVLESLLTWRVHLD